MGSGISLNEEQVAQIIIRDLIIEFNEEQSKLPLFTDEGYEIYRDFSDEVKLNNKVEKIKKFANSHKFTNSHKLTNSHKFTTYQIKKDATKDYIINENWCKK